MVWFSYYYCDFMNNNVLVPSGLERNLKENRREAYEYFYDHYASVLYGSIYSVVKDENIAVQLFEQAYLHFWSNISQHDSQQCSIIAWSLKICRKIVVDYQRLNINHTLIK